MSSLFDFDRPPDRYAVLGNPVAHSKSPQIHGLFAKQTQQAMVYAAIQVDPGGFPQAVGNFLANHGKGLNITVPFKAEAYRLADTLSARARYAGAVNTFILQDNGALRGDNTDGIGLVRDIMDNFSGTIRQRKVLILGAGGAARGIIGPLLEQQPRCMMIANRTASKAADLAQAFARLGDITALGFDRLGAVRFDLVINATSASLQSLALDLPVQLLNRQAWAYDLMYGQGENAFFDWAKRAGAHRIMDGLGMLVEQAAESFYLWRGVRPATAAVLERLHDQD